MTAQQHPAVAALEERISERRKHLHYWTRSASADTVDEEKRLLAQIAALSESLAMLRRHRVQAGEEVVKRQAELDTLEATLELVKSRPDVAQAVWLQLLLERQEKYRKPVDKDAAIR